MYAGPTRRQLKLWSLPRTPLPTLPKIAPGRTMQRRRLVPRKTLPSFSGPIKVRSGAFFQYAFATFRADTLRLLESLTLCASFSLCRGTAIIASRAPKTFAARFLDLPYAKPIVTPETSRAKAVVGRASTPLVRSNGTSSSAAKPTLRKTSAPPSSFNLKTKNAAAVAPGNSPRKPVSGRTSASGSTATAKRPAARTATPAPKATKTSIISPPPTPIPPPLSSLATQSPPLESSKVVKPLSLHGQDIDVVRDILTHLYTGDEGPANIEADLAPDQLPVTAGPEARMERLRSDMLALWKSHQDSDVTLRVGQGTGDSSMEGDTSLSNGLEHSASVISLPLADAEEEESAGSFAAHRFLLVSRSPYFAAQLLSPFSDSNSTDIRLPTPPFTPSGLYFTLGFLYTGTLNFSSRTFDLTIAFQIWRAGAYFQVRSLTTVVGSLIFHDFCHKFSCSPPCTTCLKRVPRTLAFAASPDVAEATLLNAAKAAVSGRDFGSYWAREVGTMPPALRTSLLESVKARIDGEDGACIWVLKQSMMITSRLDNERSVKWTDNLRGMNEAVVEHAQKRLVAAFEKVVDSQEWTDLVDGVGLLYDVLEKALELLLTGMNERRAAKIYQTLVGEVLLKGDEGLQPGVARDKVEEARTELIKYLQKRWVNVRATAGFNSLDKWALKEIAGEIDVPSEELILEDTPPAPTPATSRTGLKAATTGRASAAAKAAPSSATPKRPLGAASRPIAKNIDGEREAGPVDLRAAVLNRNAAKTSATHGFRSGTAPSPAASKRTAASSPSSGPRTTPAASASASRTASPATPTRTATAAGSVRSSSANTPSRLRPGATPARSTAGPSASRLSSATSGARTPASTSAASASRATGKTPQKPVSSTTQKGPASQTRPLSRAPRSSGSSTPSGHARTASSVSVATTSQGSEPQSPNPSGSGSKQPSAEGATDTEVEQAEPATPAEASPAVEPKEEDQSAVSGDANGEGQATENSENTAKAATEETPGQPSARVASPDIAARPRRPAMGSKVAGLAARFGGSSPPTAVAELPSTKGKASVSHPLAVSEAAANGDAPTKSDATDTNGRTAAPAPPEAPATEPANANGFSSTEVPAPSDPASADSAGKEADSGAPMSPPGDPEPSPNSESAAPAILVSGDAVSGDPATRTPPLSPLSGVPPKPRNHSLVAAESTKPPAPARAASVASLMARRATARRNAALRSMSNGPATAQRPSSSLVPPDAAQEQVVFPVSLGSGSATPTSEHSRTSTPASGEAINAARLDGTLPVSESSPASLGAMVPTEEGEKPAPAVALVVGADGKGIDDNELPKEGQAASPEGDSSDAVSGEQAGASDNPEAAQADPGMASSAESADPPTDPRAASNPAETIDGEPAPATEETAESAEAVGAEDIEAQDETQTAAQVQVTEADQEQPLEESEKAGPLPTEQPTEPANPKLESPPPAASEEAAHDAEESTLRSSEPDVAGPSSLNGETAGEAAAAAATTEDAKNAEAEVATEKDGVETPAQPTVSTEKGEAAPPANEGEDGGQPLQPSDEDAGTKTDVEIAQDAAQATPPSADGEQAQPDTTPDVGSEEAATAAEPKLEPTPAEPSTEALQEDESATLNGEADPQAADSAPPSTTDAPDSQADSESTADGPHLEGDANGAAEEAPVSPTRGVGEEATPVGDAEDDEDATPRESKQTMDDETVTEGEGATSTEDPAASASEDESLAAQDSVNAPADSDMLAAPGSDFSIGDEPRTPKAIKSTALPLPEADKTPRPSKIISHVNAAMELAKTPRSASLADFPATTLSVGIPCIIWPILPGVPPRTKLRALVKYIGPVEGHAGPMVGVEIPRPLPDGLQVPEGRFNDGTLGGKLYFRLGPSDSAAPSAAPSGANSPASSVNTSPSMLSNSNSGSRLSVHLDMFARAEREARKRRIARLQANAMRVVSGGSASSSVSTSNSFGSTIFSAPVSPRSEHIAPQPVYGTLMPNASTSAINESSDDDFGFGSETEGLPPRYGVRSPRPSLPSPMSSPTLRFPRLGSRHFSERSHPGMMESPPTSFSGTSLYMSQGARDGDHQSSGLPASSSGLPSLTPTSSTTALSHPYLSMARERERRCSWSPSLASVFTSRSAAPSSVRSFSRGSRRSSFTSRMEEDGPGYGLFVTPDEVMWVFEDE